MPSKDHGRPQRQWGELHPPPGAGPRGMCGYEGEDVGGIGARGHPQRPRNWALHPHKDRGLHANKATPPRTAP